MPFWKGLFVCLVSTAWLNPAPVRSVTWWVASPLVKIKPLDNSPQTLVQNASIYAARNEFEPFQLMIRPENADVEGLDVEMSSLQSQDGSRIDARWATVYAEQFIDLEKPSSVDGGAGLWPDPLVPRIDRYANERRNAFPLRIARGRNQPIWVELYVPPDAHPGDYSGSLRVASRDSVNFTVPIHLHVWAFILPPTSSLKTSFGFNGTTALKQHRGKYTSDADLYALTRLYATAALQHRISIHGGSMVPPRFHYDGHHMVVDWHDYDAEVGPFLDGSAIASGQPLHGAKATSVDLRSLAAFDNPDQQSEYWAAWVKHFKERSWDDRLFLYLWDEPAATDLRNVTDRGHAALQAAPIRTLLTTAFDTRVQDVVKIWVPLVNCLQPKPGFDEYCSVAPALTAYAPERRDGKSLWFYQSCASHGCNGPGGAYFTGWPSYMIDAPGTSNRVMQWVAWKYQIEGELYYNMDEAYASGKDPWTNIRASGGNGDGTLFYPGRPDRIGGTTDIPIESIRLKLIREGLEDYEYLALLAKLGGEKLACQFADRIVTAPYHSESRPEEFLQVRQEMGQTLDRLTSAHHAQ